MESNGNEYPQLTLFAEDTHVSRSASPGQETAPTMPAIFGRDSQTLLGFYDPDTHCWKTSQGTCLSDSTECLQIWPRAGMTHNGIVYQLRESVPRTYAIDCSVSLHGTMWPTPTASAWAATGQRLLLQQHVNNGTLTDQEKRSLQSGNRGRTNPEFVEWLMGFPAGWTDLED